MTGNYPYRVFLRCRHAAKLRFVKLRSDVLVKLQLLDNKRGVCVCVCMCVYVYMYVCHYVCMCVHSNVQVVVLVSASQHLSGRRHVN